MGEGDLGLKIAAICCVIGFLVGAGVGVGVAVGVGVGVGVAACATSPLHLMSFTLLTSLLTPPFMLTTLHL